MNSSIKRYMIILLLCLFCLLLILEFSLINRLNDKTQEKQASSMSKIEEEEPTIESSPRIENDADSLVETSSEEVDKVETEINEAFIEDMLRKAPLDNLDSSINIGIEVWLEKGIKNFYCYIDDGNPIVKEQKFDSDTTKIILTIPAQTALELGETSSSNFCSKFKTEIDKGNIGYDIDLTLSDSLKSGVYELKKCFT